MQPTVTVCSLQSLYAAYFPCMQFTVIVCNLQSLYAVYTVCSLCLQYTALVCSLHSSPCMQFIVFVTMQLKVIFMKKFTSNKFSSFQPVTDTILRVHPSTSNGKLVKVYSFI